MWKGVEIIKEKRLYTRVTGTISVAVYYNKSQIATCRAKNIGVGGLLLETKDLGLSVNSLVDIQFDTDESHQLYKIMIPAIVSRIEDGAIALTFEMLEKATEQIIQQEIVNKNNNRKKI